MKTILKKIIPKKYVWAVYKVKYHIEYRLGVFYKKVLLNLLIACPAIKHVLKIFKDQEFIAGEFTCIETISKSFPEKVNIIQKKQTPLYYSKPIFNNVNNIENEIIEGIIHNVYAARLEAVRIIGGSNLVLFDGNYALYDLKYADEQNRYKYTDVAIRYYNNDHCLINYKKAEIKIDTAISLIGNYSWNYYHLIYEILAKIETIEELNIDKGVPLLVDEICLKTPQYSELFALLNKRGRKIITVPAKTIVLVKQLYYISCPNIIPPNFINSKDIQPDDLLFDPQTVKSLKTRLLPHASKLDFPRKLYISRKNASYRRKFNEDAVCDILKRHDFYSVCPEDYSIIDQMTMFNKADYIVGGTGAAFTNLLFCKPGCKVIILYKTELLFSGFSTIARINEVNLCYVTDVVSTIGDLQDIHESFTINTESFQKIITKWLL